MGQRSYKQNCALAHASDVLGDRWTLLLIRDLMLGPRRYGDLLVSLHGIGTNLLATRLKQLVDDGVVEKSRAGNGREYRLTAAGVALEEAVLALVRWGLDFGRGDQTGFHHRNEWDLVALKSLFRPDGAGGKDISVQFRAESLTGWIRIQDSKATIGLGDIPAPDLVIQGTVGELFTADADLDALLSTGRISVLRQFMSAFARPERN